VTRGEILMTTNHWLDDRCARAFWDQYRALPYQELLADTVRWLDPAPGERWLDLGCGSGQLTLALWQASGGRIGEIVAMDCAAANAVAMGKLAAKMQPPPRPGQVRFQVGNFSDGLPALGDASFDGVVSGLAISYAESRDPATGQYTEDAYNHLLAELCRVLKPGGRLVFSVNVPEPDFWRIFWRSLRRGVRVGKPLRVLVNALKMQRYGHWLKREARRGRFHFFPLPEIIRRLIEAGFRDFKYRLSYAGQAYVISARRAQASELAASGTSLRRSA
jgi:ubiquinone/menaquinone biosynthesis C-methylase UbiE